MCNQFGQFSIYTFTNWESSALKKKNQIKTLKMTKLQLFDWYIVTDMKVTNRENEKLSDLSLGYPPRRRSLKLPQHGQNIKPYAPSAY